MVPCTLGSGSPGPEGPGYVGMTAFSMPWRVQEGRHQACEKCGRESCCCHTPGKAAQMGKAAQPPQTGKPGGQLAARAGLLGTNSGLSSAPVTLPVPSDTAPQPSSCPRTMVCHCHTGAHRTRPTSLTGFQCSSLSPRPPVLFGVLSPKGHAKDFGGFNHIPHNLQASSPKLPQINVIKLKKKRLGARRAGLSMWGCSKKLVGTCLPPSISPQASN